MYACVFGGCEGEPEPALRCTLDSCGCAGGHTGVLCGTCRADHHYEQTGLCTECLPPAYAGTFFAVMFLATFAFLRFFAEVVLPPPLQFAPIPKAAGKRSAAYQVRQALSDMTARNWHFQGKGRVLIGHLGVLNGLRVDAGSTPPVLSEAASAPGVQGLATSEALTDYLSLASSGGRVGGAVVFTSTGADSKIGFEVWYNETTTGKYIGGVGDDPMYGATGGSMSSYVLQVQASEITKSGEG